MPAPCSEQLRARGLRIGLLSNTNWPRTFHEHFLERDGLAELIDVRLYTSELGYVKPHPSVFAEALAAVEVDDPSGPCSSATGRMTTSTAPSKPGLRTVLRASPDVPPYDVEPDEVIDRLPELVGLIDRWNTATTEVHAVIDR